LIYRNGKNRAARLSILLRLGFGTEEKLRHFTSALINDLQDTEKGVLMILKRPPGTSIRATRGRDAAKAVSPDAALRFVSKYE